MYTNDGTNQNERKDFIFSDDFLNIDELSFAELVCYVADFAKKIPYYNTQNIHDESWDKLICNDEIVVISEIITCNVQKIEDAFLNIQEADFDSFNEYAKNKSSLILNLIVSFDSWHERLKKIDNFSYKGLYKFIDELLRSKLLQEYSIFKDILQSHNLQDKEHADHLRTKWESSITEQARLYTKNALNIGLFSNIFYSFFNAINFVKKSVNDFLDKSLQSHEHEPHTALLFTFLKLYNTVKKPINEIPQRYFDFYYNDILKIKPRTYIPDSAYLLLSLKDGFHDFFIAQGTQFIAGKDETGKPLYYAAAKDCVINKAEIAQLHTLYADNNALIWPYAEYSGFYTDTIPCETIETIKLNSLRKKALFGNMSSQSKKFADIGFVVCDNNLMLLEGQRTVEISVCFTEKSFNDFEAQVKALKENHDYDELLIKIFEDIFTISATSPTDWFTIETYACECYLTNTELEPYSFKFQFHLSTNDPAISGYNKDIHEYELLHDIPALRFMLNNDSYMFPYSLIHNLEIENITTRVHAQNLRNNIVYNELGKVDTTKSFYPFGVIPQLNSSLIIGNYEMSRKHIDTIGINISWDNLPETENGFLEYFEAYNEQICKSDYKCSISFLKNGYWTPNTIRKQQHFDLFTSKPLNDFDSQEKINPLSEIDNIQTSSFQVDKQNRTEAEFEYTKSSLSSFLKITFIAPGFAFGFQKYPERLSHVTMHNAKNKVQEALPNAPISPIAGDIQMEYSAISEICLSQKHHHNTSATKKLYHIHPWGYNDVLNQSPTTLLPEYKHNGSLMMGLKNASPQMTISILFNLLDDAVSEIGNTLPDFTWEYLCSNEWKTLPDFHVISDSTNGFLQTGIITLLLPDEINTDNTVLSNKYHWIRISADGNLDTICNVMHITTQAIKVTWNDNGNTDTHLTNGIPKGTIKESETLQPGIKQILQITNTFGGKPLEKSTELKIRVGERLVHKNRAVTPWDYERLILEKFSNIYKVKCIPHIDINQNICPGNVLMAVIEKADSTKLRVEYEPMVNQATLQEIKTFVQGVCSPFANIDILNPVFERVQVRCAVKIKTGLDAGYFINTLNNDLIDYITPWQTNTKNEPGFGKHIKCSDVLSFIQCLDYIEFVTDFSMLHIYRDKQKKYQLYDTAEENYHKTHEDQKSAPGITFTKRKLEPTYPWGILISVEKHALEIINQKTEITAYKTGIDELELGETFIVE